MGKLSYKIQRSLDSINEKVSISKKIKYFFLDIWYDYPYIWYNQLTCIFTNFKFFLPHIIHMRNWDNSYQITLFCDSLNYLAEGLKNGHHLNAEKQYKRCLFASAQLYRAYDAHVINDKSYQKLSKNNPIKFVTLKSGHSLMTHDYGIRGEEYYSKMFKLIHKRQEKVIEQNKKEAWEYINKHIESFWE